MGNRKIPTTLFPSFKKSDRKQFKKNCIFDVLLGNFRTQQSLREADHQKVEDKQTCSGFFSDSGYI